MNRGNRVNPGAARRAIAISFTVAMLAPAATGLLAKEAVRRTEAPSAAAQPSSEQKRDLDGLDSIQRLRADLEEAQLQMDALRLEFRMLEGRFQARFHRFMDRRWQNVTGQRAQRVPYTNDFDIPIEVSVVGDRPGQNGCLANVYVDNHRVAVSYNWNSNADKHCFAAATVPPGSTYWVDLSWGWNGNHHISTWYELRPVQ